MYALDVPTRTLTLDTVNPGDVSSWIFDYHFKIKVTAAQSYNSSNSIQLPVMLSRLLAAGALP